LNELLLYTKIKILFLVFISIWNICINLFILKFNLIYLIKLKSRIFGSHDKKINVWRFNPSYKESNEIAAEKITIDDVVKFERVIEHHKSGICCLTYDGIDCIVSSNTQGLEINIFFSIIIF
jgi:hypothetical protein